MNYELTPQPHEARSLFRLLDQIHLVAIKPDGGTTGRDFGTDQEAAIDWATAQNSSGRNIYWTVNRVRSGVDKKPAKVDIVGARFAHVDIDPPKDGSEWDRGAALEQLQSLSPSMILDSGNGVQAFWRLDGQEYAHEQVEAVNIAIRDHFGADSCQNIDRLMRVCGFINYPNAKKVSAGRKPALARWVQADSGKAFAIDQIMAALPAVTPIEEATSNAPQLPAGLHTLATNPNGLDRSADAFAFACAALREGWRDAQIANVLLDAGYPVSAHCLSQDDGQRAAQRAIDNARKEVRKESASEAAQDVVAKSGFGFTPVGELQYRPPEFLVEGLIETDSLGLIFGDPASGKSFAALDIGLCIAAGTDFHGRDVKQGPVFYIAGEGFNGLTRRIAAWQKHHALSDQPLPFFVSHRAAQLLDNASAAEVTQAIDRLAQDNTPALIVIDTLARNFGAGDENSTKDMTAFVAAVDDLRAAFPNSTILIVHHTGHAEKERARGAMALKGALDFEYRVTKHDDKVCIVNTKMKDAEPPKAAFFELESVQLDDGASSAVLVASDPPSGGKKLTANQALARKAFIAAAAKAGHLRDDGQYELGLEHWRAEFYAAHTGDNETSKRQSFHRLRDSLQKSGIISVNNDLYIWADPTMTLEVNLERD